MFHLFSPCYETSGAERHGSQWNQHSRAIEQKIPTLPNLPWPGFPCPRYILKMSQHKHYSWSLEKNQRRLLTWNPIHLEPLFMQTLPRGRAIQKLPWLCCCSQKTQGTWMWWYSTAYSLQPPWTRIPTWTFSVMRSTGHLELFLSSRANSGFLLDSSPPTIPQKPEPKQQDTIQQHSTCQRDQKVKGLQSPMLSSN